jgi:hypothetical protein
MRRSFSAVLLVVLLAAAAADKAPSRKPLGTWEREIGAAKIVFTIEQDKMRCQFNGDISVTDISLDGYVVDSRYGVTPDGIVFGVVTEVNNKAPGVAKGDLFSFSFKLENGRLTINDLKLNTDGDLVASVAKQLIQGDYKKAG